MTDNPDTRPTEGAVVPVSDTPHAPFIFYEGAAAMGHANNITLAAARGNVPAVLSLRAAIDNALLMAAPTGEGKAN